MTWRPRRKVLMKFMLCTTFLILIKLWFSKQPNEENKHQVLASGWSMNEPEQQTFAAVENKSGWIVTDTYFRGANIPDDMLAFKPPSYLPNYKNPCWYETVQETNLPASQKLRCLPYFHLIWVDKCGTTDLWYRIAQHPDIIRPEGVMHKETHWWSWKRFGFGIWKTSSPLRHFDWYLDHFDKAAAKIEQMVTLRNNITYHHLITGEGSPTVFWDFTGWKKIPQNKDRTAETAYLTPHCLHHLTPDVKLIAIFRNPTDRLYSDYFFLDNFKSYHNVSVAGFHQEVLRSIRMLTDCFTKMSKLECLFDKELHMKIPVRIMTGMYHVFLRVWLKVFPLKQLLLLRNEDYSNDIKPHLQRVFNFLQLDEELDRIEKLPRLYEKSGKIGPMMPETRLILNNFYATFDRVIESHLDNIK